MKGLLIAFTVIFCWFFHLSYALHIDLYATPLILVILHLLLQTHLYTGLFITAHDAIHRTVHSNSIVNYMLGATASLLYAGLWYPRLQKNHHLHHKYAGTAFDPDYHVNGRNFFLWFFSFMVKYTTFVQLVLMAVTYNLMLLSFREFNVVIFWMVPALLSTVQLFYFGTYMPHKLPHTNEMVPHNARSLPLNHYLAFISCYFFGYHFEHHAKPHIPWWRLYKTKEEFNEKNKRTSDS